MIEETISLSYHPVFLVLHLDLLVPHSWLADQTCSSQYFCLQLCRLILISPSALDMGLLRSRYSPCERLVDAFTCSVLFLSN
jgi:hypothetical protein